MCNPSTRLCDDYLAVNFDRQLFHALGQRLDRFCELSVLLHHLKQQGLLLCCQKLSLLTGMMKVLTMLGVGHRVRLVAIRLSRLRRAQSQSVPAVKRSKCVTALTSPKS